MHVTKFAVVASVLALAAAPAVALGSQPPNAHHNNPHAQGNQGNDSGSGTPSSHAKAYGKLCQNASKKHVAGTPATPFSKCVTDMAKAAKGTNPTTACKNESKKHVKGQKGTPFSQCVSAAAKLQKQQQS